MTAVPQPSGTVTLVFSDIEGSTRLLEELGTEAYREALAEHRRIVREGYGRYQGYEVDYEGDAFFYAFSSAEQAVSAVSEAMAGLEEGPIAIRVGIHTGTPALDPPKYVGMDVHFAARVMSSAHGRQVVLSAVTAELIGARGSQPRALPLVDLGEHRLKDIPEAVSLYQLGEGSFPPLKTISNTNLPRPASSFLGREAELAEVLARIEQGARLVTLTGPGGTGKTRLALEAASTLVPSYKAGVFWVGLASLRDPALVTETIAQTLGAKDGLASHISERELLLLLDNLEQVVECAPELSALLEGCPQLTLLVTSRELLRIQGEVEYPVPPLAQPEAVSLFCERAGLEPSDEIAGLCARLDSLPLALELAAARTKALSVSQILERLAGRLDLLRGGRDADPRQATLRATIAWSYDLLTPAEQQLFARLSVFAGGCTLEAAEEVCDADLDTLQSLLEKSLLRFTPSEPAPRYWMLETIREYAIERLAAAGRTADASARMCRFILQHVALHDVFDFSGGLLSSEWYDRFDADLPNVRESVVAALAANRGEEAARLSLSLYAHALARGGLTEASVHLDKVLAHAQLSSAETLATLRAHSDTTLRLGDPTRALSSAREQVALARAIGDDRELVSGLRKLGHVQMDTGDLEGATSSYEESLALARRIGDVSGTAAAVNNLGALALSQGQWADGVRLTREAAVIFDRLDDRDGMAIARHNEGFAQIRLGRLDVARLLFADSLRIADELGWKEGRLFPVEALGALAVLADDVEQGAVLIGFGARLRGDLGLAEFDPIQASLVQEATETCLRALRPARWEVLRSQGASLTDEEAVRLALEIADGYASE